ncbi:alanine racemase [Mesorhizobium sp. SB112]|uniref:alanine racemase n=1 Tax=Mesorhizobium sp. SB112 TaxID=3151853 RepID=UPI003263175D
MNRNLNRTGEVSAGLVQAGAVLTADLGAIRANYRTLKTRLGGKSCAAVVKADGYGLGTGEVARALLAEGCDTFFVAHVNEGFALRDALGQQPVIYILNGVSPGAEAACVDANLRAVLNSRAQLDAWRTEAQRRGASLAAAIQVDSGMSRLGMSPDEVEAIALDPSLLQGIDVSLVMSHLACADEPDHPANEAQRTAFELLRKLLPNAPASLANSSGIFLGPDFHFDLARPGAALYGINPTPGKPNPMRAVVKLEAKVIQTRVVEADIGVGYGHTFRSRAPLRLATISLGYADGWRRNAVMSAWFNDIELPFAGRVSMDSIILDISGLPENALKPGDLVELIGPHQSVDDVAAAAGTIGYEILTSLAHRFHRIYAGS